ncbi:hypothetical protein AB0J80_11785 [Actinoplanes sp. NPDC049548]|uniref:hypothetical protein n=1 Tax=Actinoplanes sp. NPDC049548 TaxID=3155152 RepID=UPI003414A404
MDDATQQAVRAALGSLDKPWRASQPMAAAEPPIPVTGVQWQTVLQDSDVLSFLEQARNGLADINAAIKGGPRSVGRRLRFAVSRLTEAVHDMNLATADVLAFDPPQRDRRAAFCNHTEQVSAAIAQLLDGLEQGADPSDAALLKLVDGFERFIEVEVEAEAADHDPVARIYGVPVGDLDDMRLPVGQSLRAAFSDRPVELGQITACIVGFASRGQPLSEQLDGALHPFALATDSYPLVAQRAARDACDLVRAAAALDVRTAAAVVVSAAAREQKSYSTHRGLSKTRRDIAAAPDEDARTRAVADLYRMLCEGPLRSAAVETLGFLGESLPSTAGLNDIRSRLLVHRTESPLCEGIAYLIEPAWRNARAHEDLHWDPERGKAIFGETAVDLPDVEAKADLMWSMCRGFQAGIQIARGILPALAEAIDQAESVASPVSRDIELAKVFGVASLVVDDIRRDSNHVTMILKPLHGAGLASRIGIALVNAAALDSSVSIWTIETEDLPDFSVGRSAVQLAATLLGPGPDGQLAFLYPTSFAPLLAEALTRNGAAIEEAASQAWDLPLRDTLTCLPRLVVAEGFGRQSSLRNYRRAARRTNQAVQAVASYLGVQAPEDLDLTALCNVVRKLEQRPHDNLLAASLRREHQRLVSALGPLPADHPWHRLTT